MNLKWFPGETARKMGFLFSSVLSNRCSNLVVTTFLVPMADKQAPNFGAVLQSGIRSNSICTFGRYSGSLFWVYALGPSLLT